MKGLLATTLAFGVLVPGGLSAGTLELPRSPNWQQGNFGKLTAGTTYTASLVTPTPTIRPSAGGWMGTQIVTHQFGKIRYESVVLLGHDGEIDLLTGPAMTRSPQAQIDWTWNRRFDRPFGPLKRWRVAGRTAIAFDGTNTGKFEFTLVGANPPEVQMDRGQSFRLAAFSVHGRTVVLAIRSFHLEAFLPTATRLLDSLEFPAS